MFELHNITWVVPGLCFLFIYNKRHPSQTISLTGWPYIFFLVIIACITWLPAEWIAETYWTTILEGFIQLKTFIIAIVITTLLILVFQIGWFAKLIFTPVYDNFYRKCIEWENKNILLTLKNGKVYNAFLWKYPDDPRSRYETQTISIVPFKSGYRDKITLKVIWNNYYPKYVSQTDIQDMEIIIPRSEIINFGKFNNKTFEHFQKQNNQS